MHELSIAEGVLRIVDAEAKQRGFTRVLSLRMRIGEFSGVLPDCLREFFPLAAKGGPAEGAALLIEEVPGRFRCATCGYEGAIARRAACCPVCGGSEIRMVAGRECYVEDMTVE